MVDSHLDNLVWRKSSRSSQANNCVEITYRTGGAAIRDSKNRGGAILEFAAQHWSVFVRGLPR